RCFGGACGGFDGGVTDAATDALSSDVEPIDGSVACIVDVKAGWSHTCARKLPGGLFCWGNDNSQQVSPDVPADTLEDVPLLVDPSSRAFGTGDSFTCTVHQNGTVRCWGFNSAGQLGQTSNDFGPVDVPNVSNVVDLSAGNEHVCARLADGHATCWGANTV